jgi:hypothetical protein
MCETNLTCTHFIWALIKTTFQKNKPKLRRHQSKITNVVHSENVSNLICVEKSPKLESQRPQGYGNEPSSQKQTICVHVRGLKSWRRGPPVYAVLVIAFWNIRLLRFLNGLHENSKLGSVDILTVGLRFGQESH